MPGSLLPQPKQVAFDSAMNPGIAYQFYTYDVGTLTPKSTYQDAALTIANTNPVIANARGEVVMYGTGAYRLILKDSLGSTIWDRDNVESPSAVASAISAALAASGGSALVGFQQLGASTVRTMQDKMRDIVSVKDFGATGNGSTDDTAAIQSALNTVTRGILYFPKGTYKFSTLTAPNPVRIQGEGKYTTTLLTTSATLDALVCTSPTTYEFADFTFAASVARTAGAFIKIAPSSVYNSDSTFDRINMSAPYIGVNFISAAGWSFNDCYFGSYVNAGIYYGNANTPDAGDCFVGDCTFDGAGGTVSSIVQTSAGGLKAIGNKFLGGSYHYLGQFNTGAATSTTILVFNGNSTENAGVANMAFSSQTNTPFGRIVINGNQFSIGAAATGILVSDPGYVWLDGISIDANQFAFNTGAIGINIARASRVSLGKNTYLGNGTSTGVIFGVNNGAAVVGFQDFQNITTEWGGTFTNATFNPPRMEAGVANGTTNVTYSGLYASAAATVTFAKPFAKPPYVTANAFASAGGISVLIGTPTTTGFAYQIIGATNGGAASMQWVAQG